MNFRLKNTKITFENFLSGMSARDYIFQEEDYDALVQRAAQMIREADYVLIGAGAGMSTAAGAKYGGEWFAENFGQFQEKYGRGPYMQDMYSAGFYPYPDEESFWGYWSRQALLGGMQLDVTPLHKVLLDSLKGKEVFCLSTNADGQFVKAGLPEEKIFCTQGDYFHIQCAKGCHPRIYNAEAMFRQMDQARKDCKVPTYMVPKCPVCGGKMTMNLRCDGYFVQDSKWYAEEKRFGDYLSEALSACQQGKKLCLLEVGVGFNTPTIIRFPFEKLIREHENISLVRLNLNEAVVQESQEGREVGINEDMAKSIVDIAQALTCKK